MFKNIGHKIKLLAKVNCFVAIILGIITFLISASTSGSGSGDVGMFISILIIIIGLFSSWPLFGFGQLIEDTSENVKLQRDNNKILKDLLLSKNNTQN